MYVLDTDIIILFLKHHQSVVDLMATIQDQDLAISVLSIGEIYDGLLRRSETKKAQFANFLKCFKILDLDEQIAIEFGSLRNFLRGKNQVIGDIDTLIATTCLVHQATLVTSNRKHYARVPKLDLLTL